MNNWPIILLPALALGGFAYGVWQHLFARHDAERAAEKRYEALQEDYRQLQVDHGVDVVHLGAAEQEVERLLALNDNLTTLKANFAQENVRLQGLLADTRKQRDELNRENEKLHTREKLLIDTLNKQHPLEEMAIRTSQRLEEKGKVDEDTVVPTVTQDSAEAQTIRNTRQRKGAPRKEP